jgi:hypothetical protein
VTNASLASSRSKQMPASGQYNGHPNPTTSDLVAFPYLIELIC